MVIHTLQKAKKVDRERLKKILRMHTTNQKIRDEAISIMKRYHAVEYAKDYARKLVQESWDEVSNELPSSSAKEKLYAFANYLINRDI